jgi:hypothetical protein
MRITGQRVWGPRWGEMDSNFRFRYGGADILVLSAKLMIVSRSARGRSASLSSFETPREPGDFTIESPSRILPIDRITD